MKRILSILAILLIAKSLMAQAPIDSLERIVAETENDTTRVETLLRLTLLHFSRNLGESVEYGNLALEEARNIPYQTQEYEALNYLGVARFYQANYELALGHWREADSVLQHLEQNTTDSIRRRTIISTRALILNNIGAAYKNIGQYDRAIEYYQENLKIQEDIGNQLQMGRGRSNIANVHFYFGLDYEKALEFYQQSLDHFQQHIDDNPSDAEDGQQGLANTYLNIGIVHKEQDNLDLALESFQKALNNFRDLDDQQGIARTQGEIGLVYLEYGEYQEALDASLNALRVYREIGQRKEEADVLQSIGRIYHQWRKYEQALDYYNQGLVISMELQLKREVYDIHRDISEVYKGMGNYAGALEQFEKYNELKDSSLREENLKQISELETKYETDRIERENQLLNVENELQQTELKRQRIFLFSVVGIALIIFVFGSVTYRQYQQKKRANILLEEQNIEIKQQRDQIFQQKQEITDSITYASRIQNAVLPPNNLLAALQDHFILYKPRDIVSGDYYWMTTKDGKTIVTAADCTGHGVPGAFMSMLGISFLNEIVNKSDTTQANEILNQLRDNVVASLRQTGMEGEAQDGMDMALVVVDVKTKHVQYAGAYNPLYLIRNGELLEHKPDKMPIGIHKEKTDPFSNNEFQGKSGDVMYIFSDGYVDQFGGPRQKKFMTKNFKELLLSIHEKPMSEQQETLDNIIVDWMKDVDQVDDILVMGLKV